MKDGKPVMAFGLMGGSQQAQGHAQVLVDIIESTDAWVQVLDLNSQILAINRASTQPTMSWS